MNTQISIHEIKVHENQYNKRSGEVELRAPKIYVHAKNYSVIDSFLERGNEPYKVYKADVLPMVLNSLKESHPHLYDQLKDAKWSWNKSCGCSMCPCSPGFLVKGMSLPVDIYVDIA